MNQSITLTELDAHPNLVAHLKLDAVQEKGGKASVLDALGRSNAAAEIHGNPKLIADQRFGACLRFNQADQQPADDQNDTATTLDDYLLVPLKKIDFSQGFSFSCWVWIDADKVEILDSGDFSFYFDEGEFICSNPEEFRVKLNTKKPQITQQVWSQLAITVQANGDTQFFANGLPLGSMGNTRNADTLANSHSPWKIGMYNKDWLFKGKMAHIRFYNSALNASEIQQQWSLDQAVDQPLPFSQTAPVDFEFWDEDHKPIIYTEGGEVSHQLSVALWNKDRTKRPLVFAEPAKLKEALKPTSLKDAAKYFRDNHHIELRFPRATLSSKVTTQLNDAVVRRATHNDVKSNNDEATTQTKDDWMAWYQDQPELNAESIYLISPIYQKLEVSDVLGDVEVMEIVLPHLTANAGPYSVPVELRPGPMLSYAGEAAALGKRIRNLQVQTQKGYKFIPLHFDVIGSNTVINDGSKTQLLLRLTNIDPVTSIKIRNSGNLQSQFILSCELAKHGGHHEWALSDEADKITVEIGRADIIEPDCQINNDWQSDAVEHSSNGETAEWIINGSRLSIDQLAPNQSVYIRFTVSTTLPTGLSDLHCFYRHIEGYWDGHRACTVQKSPLVFQRQHAIVSSFASKKEFDATYKKGLIGLETTIYEFSPTRGGTKELRRFSTKLNSQVRILAVYCDHAVLDSLVSKNGLANQQGTNSSLHAIIFRFIGLDATECAPTDESRAEDLNSLIPHLETALGFSPLKTPEHIGIGTNHPASKLSVTDGITIGGEWATTQQAPTSGLLVEGRVGFGTPHPETRLHIHQGRLRISELTGSATIELKNNQHTNQIFTDGTSGHLNICTNSKTHHIALQFDKQGHVGIGTSAPASKLAVSGGMTIGDANFSTTKAADSGDLHIQNQLYMSKGKRIHFKDNGEIRSGDSHHRILFRRDKNIMELREHGKIVFSPGATSGQATSKMTLNANGHLEVNSAITNKNCRIQESPKLIKPLKNDNVRHNLFSWFKFNLKCKADVLFLIGFKNIEIHHDSYITIFLQIYTEGAATDLTSLSLKSAQYNSKDRVWMSQSAHHMKTGLAAGNHWIKCQVKCSGTYLPKVSGCTLSIIQL